MDVDYMKFRLRQSWTNVRYGPIANRVRIKFFKRLWMLKMWSNIQVIRLRILSKEIYIKWKDFVIWRIVHLDSPFFAWRLKWWTTFRVRKCKNCRLYYQVMAAMAGEREVSSCHECKHFPYRFNNFRKVKR